MSFLLESHLQTVFLFSPYMVQNKQSLTKIHVKQTFVWFALLTKSPSFGAGDNDMGSVMYGITMLITGFKSVMVIMEWMRLKLIIEKELQWEFKRKNRAKYVG